MSERDSVAAGSARVYGRGWRPVAALLFALSRISLPLLLVLVVVATDPPIDLPLLLQLLALYALAPALAAHFIRRKADLALRDAELVLRRADLVVAVPYDAIARVAPWTIPLPGPGATLHLRSGARLRYAIECADLVPLLNALSATIGGAARTALAHPTVVYAHAAAAAPLWRRYHYGCKFVLFALAPTAVFFNAHQHIAYGGPLGEYYMFGAAAYLRTFAVYWLTLVIYLILFAGLWRGIAEIGAWLAAWIAPARATAARRIAERCCQVLYYGGVPALVAVRFLT
jgi:hypothetical protein